MILHILQMIKKALFISHLQGELFCFTLIFYIFLPTKSYHVIEAMYNIQ